MDNSDFLTMYTTGGNYHYVVEDTPKHIYTSNEAKILGVENDERFIESTLVTMLEMDDQEYNECVRELNKKFIDSKYSSFDDFMESLMKEDGVGIS